MLRYITKKILYGLLVLIGVVILVFFLFQGFGDPSRLVMGQTGDSTTQANIRKNYISSMRKESPFPNANNFYFTSMMFLLFVFTAKKILKETTERNFYRGQYKVWIKDSLPP